MKTGDKVKIIIMFRGREVLHVDMGEKTGPKIIEALKDIGDVEQKPKIRRKKYHHGFRTDVEEDLDA